MIASLELISCYMVQILRRRGIFIYVVIRIFYMYIKHISYLYFGALGEEVTVHWTHQISNGIL